MTTVLVTGAAGFIGSHLTEALLARGDRVVGVDSFNDYYDPAIKRGNLETALQNPAFTLHEADICDGAKVLGIMEAERPGVVVHLAARAGVRPSLEDPVLYHQVNGIGSQHVLDACRAFPPSHIVFASTSSVYGGLKEVPFHEEMDIRRPISPYAATKRGNELMCHVYHHIYGMKITLLRFFTVYGPRQRPDMAIHKFVDLIARGKPIPMFGDGGTRRDYTYIDDIIHGVVQAINRPFDYEIFNLGEQTTTSLRELIAMIGEAMGVEPAIDQHGMQPGDVEITYADISKARRMLDYSPQFPVAEGIKRFVDWYRSSAAAPSG